ncbi:MAG: hypothetical protein ACXWW6_00655 [Candidatus Limnocylindrales bacterium]
MRAVTFLGLARGVVLGLGLLTAGCAGPPATPARTPPSGAVPSRQPTPSPISSRPATSDSAAVRAAAAKAYLVAARAYNATKRALSSGNVLRNFEQTRTYYRKLAKAEHAFLVAIRTVDFPVDVGPRVDLLLKLTAESEAWQLKGSVAKTAAALDKIEPSIRRADQAASLAADLLRKDLGLPPIYL